MKYEIENKMEILVLVFPFYASISKIELKSST